MVDALKEFNYAAKAKHEARVADLAAKEMAHHCDLRIKKAKARLARAEALLAEAVMWSGPMANSLEKKINKFISEKFDV